MGAIINFNVDLIFANSANLIYYCENLSPRISQKFVEISTMETGYINVCSLIPFVVDKNNGSPKNVLVDSRNP